MRSRTSAGRVGQAAMRQSRSASTTVAPHFAPPGPPFPGVYDDSASCSDPVGVTPPFRLFPPLLTLRQSTALRPPPTGGGVTPARGITPPPVGGGRCG